MHRRGSGILIHIPSLPSPFGIGDFGPWAYRFADFLAAAKQSFWQILPLSPTEPAFANSPYHSTSAFAINPLFISPELLVQDGLLDAEDIRSLPDFPEGRIDYETVAAYKRKLFYKAYESFKKVTNNYEYEAFCRENSHWLDGFSLFIALKAHFHGKVWSEWPGEIKDAQGDLLRSFQEKLRDRIDLEKFLQFTLFKEWSSLKLYCNRKGIRIIGDIPIYVQYDSADVWRNPEIFNLDKEKRPCAVAGVPPDYFSETGQLWGNPVYRWEELKATGYNWWIKRIEHNLKIFELVRVDHFRGFVGYWEVQAGESNALNGRWVEAPAHDFFKTLLKRFPYLPVIAEDLGVITPDVSEVMEHFGFPGMKVLLFAFGEDISTNPYIPHNLVKNCVMYTGTHDNNTVRGWFEREASPEDRKRLFQYMGREVPGNEVPWEFIRLAMMSVADTVIIPMQDILSLGEDARINLPATTKGNWEWRLLPPQLTPRISGSLLEMTEIYGRI